MVTIVLPTYNEKDNIVDLIADLKTHIRMPLEVVVVDDDSPDGTWKIVEDCNDPSVRVVRRSERGLATAIDRGLEEAKGDIVGWMDADQGMPPAALPGMLECLNEYDIAIGSRYLSGAGDNRGFFRVLTSRVINTFAGLLLGFDIKDYDSGFIVLKKSVFDKVSFPSSGYGDYFIEFIYKCKKAGFSIKEVPYIFREREKGESKTAPGLVDFFRLGSGYVARIVRLRFSKQ
jgi:dolichol-phosphate mannosyltransferase